MRLFFASWVTSARPSSSRSGGMYMPKRPRSHFFRPYQPPTGLVGERPHASSFSRRLLLVGATELDPVAVLLQHRVQIVDRACVVEERRLADDTDDHALPVPLIEVHLVLGGLRGRLQPPRVIRGSRAAHPTSSAAKPYE